METPPLSRPDPPPATGTEVAPATLDGWFVLHQLYRLEWSLLNRMDPAERDDMLAEFADLLLAWSTPSEEGWSGAYRMVGGGVDLMVLHFRTTLDGLTTASQSVCSTRLFDGLILDHEYVSIVELGMYPLTASVAGRVDPEQFEEYSAAIEEALDTERDKGHVQRRLFPIQPETMPYVSYYPMDKRRDHGQNWYRLSIEKRAELMRAHGTIGRRFAGQISQVISGSIGLADWEWAVTLWAADPSAFKRIVTEMRYDKASAAYAEFGRFFVGRRMTDSDIRGWLA